MIDPRHPPMERQSKPKRRAPQPENARSQNPVSQAQCESASLENPDHRKKRTRFSRQACPNCHSATLERRHLPLFLRPLRIVPGLKPRSYRCQSCHKSITMWRKSAD
jgi:transposase-like protein